MMLAADYPFLDVLWTMLIFFLWVCWFMLLFHVIGDVFRRRDVGGGTKTLWLLFVLFVPFLGTFVYLIANSARHCGAECSADGSGRRVRGGGRDRAGKGAARERHHQPGGVQRDQGQGARLTFKRFDEDEEVMSPAAAVRPYAMPPQ